MNMMNNTTSSTAIPSGTLRITGLASGMNVDAIVQKMIAADSIPLNEMKQQRQLMAWQRDDYRSMNTSLTDLKNNVFNLKLQSSFISRNVTSSDATSVTATAGADVPIGQYKISVSQLASASSNFSAATISQDPNNKIDPNQTLSSQSFKSGIVSASTINMQTYDANGTPVKTTINIDPSKDTLNDVLGKITNSGIGVRAFYDSSSDKVMLERTKTGNFSANASATPYTAGIQIDFSSSSATFLTNTLQMQTSKEIPGRDAKFTYNDSLAVTSHDNTYTVGGLSLDLSNTTTYDTTTSTYKDITLNVTNDVSTAFNNIKDFVTKYNDTIQKVNDKIAEKRNRDYPPLTDDQKKAMSDSNITLWNKKAHVGMLENDQILPGGLSQMRIDLYSPVTGVSNTKYDQLAEIGITTSPNWQDHGKLIVNDTKLKAALADDPNAVMELFTNKGTSGDYNSEGIAQRLSNTIDNTMKQIESKAGNSYDTYNQYYLGNNIHDIDTRITDFNKHLSDLQNRYYKEFTAMEQAISTDNQQAAYIQKNFG